MSSSRRSSRSSKSTATTRSTRPPTWRAASLISGTLPGPHLKNSSAPEVSVVIAEPEPILGSTSASASSKLAPTISKQPRLESSPSVNGRLIVERKTSTRTRLRDVFWEDDLGEGLSTIGTQPSDDTETGTDIVFPSSSSPPSQDFTLPANVDLNLAEEVTASTWSSSPGSWFSSLGRSKGKAKATDYTANIHTRLVQDTPKAAPQSLAAAPLDKELENNEELTIAIEALGSESFTTNTIRATSPPSLVADPKTPRTESSLLTTGEYSRTIRTSDRSKSVSNSHSQKHSWFNPFAPYPSEPLSIAASTSTSPIASSPLSRASSSHIGSIDDEVPSLAPEIISSVMDTSINNNSRPIASHEISKTPQPRKRLDSLNSLNPSTSRFTISLPLLGRPKMRLEDAVQQQQQDSIDTDGKKKSEVNAADAEIPFTSDSATAETVEGHSESSMAMETATSNNAVVKDAVFLPVQPVKQTVDAVPGFVPLNDTVTDSTPSQSWWSYVGWGPSQDSLVHPAVPSSVTETSSYPLPLPDPAPDHSSLAPQIVEPSDNIASQKPAIEGEHDISVDAPSESPYPRSESLDQGKAASISSHETARAAGSWFNPWAWYSAGDNLASQPPLSTVSSNNGGGGRGDSDGGNGDGDGDNDDVDQNGTKQGMTESEKIKEAALARDNAAPAEPVTTAVTSSLAREGQRDHITSPFVSEPVNPIADSASSLRSGWASFFSLSRGRSLVVKSVGHSAELTEPEVVVKKDENGVEIMDLTDEDEAGTVNALDPEPEPEAPEPLSASEEAVTKVPVSTALALIRALAGPDSRRSQMIEDRDGNNENSAPLARSSEASNITTSTAQVRTPGSLPSSPIKPNAFHHERAPSVSTVRTSVSSIGNRLAPPLTISDDIKASVAAAKNGKQASASPARKQNHISSSLPKDGIVISSGHDHKEKSKPRNKSGTSTPAALPTPNLVLPTWEDTFHTLPRSWMPDHYLPVSSSSGGIGSTIGKTMRYMSGMLLGNDGYTSDGESSRFSAGAGATKRRSRRASSRRRSISGASALPGGAGLTAESELIAKEREKLRQLINWGENLPRAWDVIDAAILSRSKPSEKKEKSRAVPGEYSQHPRIDVTKGCKQVVIIGIHGWFPGAVMRSMFGEPTGTSPKFVSMMEQALEEFQSVHGVKFDKVTKIPLEGEGTIDGRVEKLYANLLSNDTWVEDLHNADVIFVATHSQGSVVSTHLLDRLIRDRHIRTSRNAMSENPASEPISGLGVNIAALPPQRVCCLCLCGIHLGPLRYLSTSSLVQPYIQYFESAAARELFEFQNTESDVSKAYVRALRNVVEHETKMVYVASLNDQVVPIYSGLFTSASHPLILRALYIDGDAYNSSDFLTNLLVLLLRVLNCGLSDSGLLAHLSEVTAGSLNGIGHSTAYEELSTFSLAVDYLFLTNTGIEDHPELTVESFNASNEMNDYEIPWALRDLIADTKVAHYFSQEITQLRDAFREWHPKTTPLRDIKRKLQPIQRLPSTTTPGTANSASKL